jgi:quercetin dioxygenase-like cupin family protein
MDYFNIDSVAWKPVRPDTARGIQGKDLLEGKTKIVLTRVEQGGKFASHTDGYGHLFYFLAGEGVVRVEGQDIKAGPGTVVRVAAGEEHSYENTGQDFLVLISANIP